MKRFTIIWLLVVSIIIEMALLITLFEIVKITDASLIKEFIFALGFSLLCNLSQILKFISNN